MSPIKYLPDPFVAKNDGPNAPKWSFTKFNKADYEINLDLVPIGGNPAVRGSASVTATIEFEVDSATPIHPVIEFTESLTSNISEPGMWPEE